MTQCALDYIAGFSAYLSVVVHCTLNFNKVHLDHAPRQKNDPTYLHYHNFKDGFLMTSHHCKPPLLAFCLS